MKITEADDGTTTVVVNINVLYTHPESSKEFGTLAYCEMNGHHWIMFQSDAGGINLFPMPDTERLKLSSIMHSAPSPDEASK